MKLYIVFLILMVLSLLLEIKPISIWVKAFKIDDGDLAYKAKKKMVIPIILTFVFLILTIIFYIIK